MANSGEPVLAVDLGGTNIRVALIDQSGHLLQRLHRPAEVKHGPAAVIARIAGLINQISEGQNLPKTTPVGVASPGPLDPRQGVVLFTPNLPGWHHVPLASELHRQTGHPVRVANDGNCAALGEWQFGAARDHQNVVYLGLGTGVGSGVISNGYLIDGVRGLGVELGHVVVALDGPRCTCGGIGCLEAFTSGWAIARDGELLARSEEGQTLREVAGDPPINASTLAAAAQRGDDRSRAVLANAGRALGAGIGAFINIFNPSIVVIGGGVSTVGDVLLEPARAAMALYSFAANRADVTLSLAQLGDDVGLLGAAALAFSHSND